MSYLTQSQANHPAAIAGVIAVHAGLAAVLLAGLAVKEFVKDEEPKFTSHTFPDPPPPEVEPTIEPKPQPSATAKPVPSPIPPVNLGPTIPIEIDPIIPNVSPVTLPIIDVGTGAIQAIERTLAVPRNDPGAWVTDADYRSRWIREERFGTASFDLEVGANGRVSDCTITRSTGHAVLDKATCSLITRRARFNPARDGNGTAIAGTYSSSIRWVLPD